MRRFTMRRRLKRSSSVKRKRVICPKCKRYRTKGCCKKSRSRSRSMVGGTCSACTLMNKS